MRPANPVRTVEQLVADACEGHPENLRELLLRRSGLPGPRPNYKLAVSVARLLASHGNNGRQLLHDMRQLGIDQAPVASAHTVFPMVGVLGLGVVACNEKSPSERCKHISHIRAFADDERREIRDAVVIGLEMCFSNDPVGTLACLDSWSQGYFPAVQMLRAMCTQTFIDQLRTPHDAFERLGQAFSLAQTAPRSHQRSQGYRALVEQLATTLVAFAKRFSDETSAWIEQHAPLCTHDLLHAMQATLDKLQQQGLPAANTQRLQGTLDQQVPPPRDPRWHVGPTRKRSKRNKRSK